MEVMFRWVKQIQFQGVTWTDNNDVIKSKYFPHNGPFAREIHKSPVNSQHKGQWCGALMFSLICAWINGWVNNREAGDLRRHRSQYDVSVMSCALPIVPFDKNRDCILASIIILDDIECYMINHVSAKALEIKFMYKDLRSQTELLAVYLIIRSWYQHSICRGKFQLRRRIILLAYIHLYRETWNDSCITRLRQRLLRHVFVLLVLFLCGLNNANYPILFPTYENQDMDPLQYFLCPKYSEGQMRLR